MMIPRPLRLWLARVISRAQKLASAPARAVRRRKLAKARTGENCLSAFFGSVGCWMLVDPASYFADVYIDGFYEPGLVNYIKRTVLEGWTCFDVGANVGFFSLAMARQVGVTGNVYAFEPTPSTCRMLRVNVELNGFKHVKVEQLALADCEGSLPFNVGPPGYEVYNTAGKVSHPSAAVMEFSAITVPCELLDSFFARNRIDKVDFIKIDVEGAELQVLRGAEKVLLSNPGLILVIEFADQTAAGFGYTAKSLGEWLQARGWDLFLIKSSGKLTPLVNLNKSWIGQMIVATRSPV